MAGREVEDESLVNLPNWLHLTFRIEDGEWFDVADVTLDEYRQELDLRRALLTKRLRFRDPEGRDTEVTERRFLSMANPNVAALRTTLRPVNWSGRVTFRSALDGRVSNDGVARYRGLANRHLTPVQVSASDPEALLLEMETSQSHIRVAEAARTRVLRDGEQTQVTTATFEEPDWVGVELRTDATEGEPITAEKVVGMYTSREPALSEPALEAGRDMIRLAEIR